MASLPSLMPMFPDQVFPPLKLFAYVNIDYVCVGGLVDAIILCKDCWIIHKKKYVCESSYMHYLCIGRLVDDVLVC